MQRTATFLAMAPDMLNLAHCHSIKLAKAAANKITRPAVFLDRDGVLNYDYGYVTNFQDIKWIPGSVDTIRAFNRANWYVFIISNQAAIARDYCTYEDVLNLNRQLQKYVRARNANLTEIFFCPYHKNAANPKYRSDAHKDRKPNPGMLLQAMRKWPTDKGRSILIGDRDTDTQAGQAAGVASYKFDELNLYNFCKRKRLLPT